MMDKRLPVISIMGSTCTGKTELAIKLCEKFPIEIISVDSAMIYEDMNIGTDKPLVDILESIKHHLINIRKPNQDYNVGDFYTNVSQIIKDIHQRNRIPLLTGGSLMYFHSLYHGLSSLPSANNQDRIFIDNLLDMYSLQDLHHCLKSIDIISYNKINPNDKQRIQRALEVYMSTGSPISSLFNTKDKFFNLYDILTIKMFSSDREVIHNKIALRIEEMIERGLMDEVKYVFKKYNLSADSKSMKIIGYKHVLEHLLNATTIDDLKNKCLFATRQLAKRQITWLKQFPSNLDIDIINKDYDIIYKMIERHCNLIK